MAGLFDQALRLPGLLGRFQPIQQRAGNALGRVFGGMDDPRLNPEQNEQARRQAILQSGLATLAASQQSGATGLGSIAQGAMYGQQAGMQGREQMVQQGAQQSQQADLQRIMQGSTGDDPLPMLYEMYKHAAATGNTQLGTSLATLIQAREASRRNTTAMPSLREGEGVNPETGKPEKYLLNPVTGERKWTGVSPVVSPTSTSSDIQEQRRFTRENSLRDDYRAEVGDVEQAYKFIDNALKRRTEAQAGDPASQVALLYAFVKAMDPNSVVREGEIALAGAAAPLWARAQAMYADVVKGDSPAIPPPMIGQMADLMEQMQAQKEGHWSEVYDNYAGSAERWGVDTKAFRKPPTKYRTRAAGPRKGPL